MTRTLITTAIAIAAGAWLGSAPADAAGTTTTLTFDDLAAGSVLSTQYAALGVTFTANAFSGGGSSTSGAAWADDTDLTVVSSTGDDVGALGTSGRVCGNLLRSHSGYLNEDGDASFRITFSAAVGSISVSFAGVSSAADARLFVYDGTTLLATLAGSGSDNQFALGYGAASITGVVVAPGSSADDVAVDNIVFSPLTAVPEAGTRALFGGGLAALVWRRARRLAPLP